MAIIPARSAVLVASLALVWAPPVLAGSAVSGQLPDLSTATYVLTEEGAGEQAGAMRTCLAGLGMQAAEAPVYLVQFGRVLRLRKALVVQGSPDAASRPRQSRQRGKRLEIASLAFTEIASGKVVYQAEISRKVRKKPARTAIVSEICALLRPSPPLSSG